MLSKTVSRLGSLNIQLGHGIHGQQLLKHSVRSFASGGQYDVCVIGGGPGGKWFESIPIYWTFTPFSQIVLVLSFPPQLPFESHFDDIVTRMFLQATWQPSRQRREVSRPSASRRGAPWAVPASTLAASHRRHSSTQLTSTTRPSTTSSQLESRLQMSK